MKLLNTYTLIEKKSRFVAYYYEIDSINDVTNILTSIRADNKKARHIPFAYKIDNEIKKSDDEEPSNTAGTPIYTIIEKKKLNHILIVVVRYFGGIKLGAGGLFRVYMKAANQVTTSAKE